MRGRPDLIVASAVREGLSGSDLIGALKATPATRRVPLALLTSFAPGHSSLAKLPDGVPVIRKGPEFGDDLARALAHCGIVCGRHPPGRALGGSRCRVEGIYRVCRSACGPLREDRIAAADTVA